MQQILVYGDSLSWGIIPGTRNRFEFTQRWPGVMEMALRERGLDVRVIEYCLNGRRTMFDDPDKPGRNGLVGIEQTIEIHSPLDLVVLMLGTNDFQSVHNNTVEDSANGIAALVNAIRQAPVEPGMPIPEILIVAPPAIGALDESTAAKFDGAAEHSAGLAAAFESVAEQLQCRFFDAGCVTSSSRVDGIHLDAEQHIQLGQAIASLIAATRSDQPR